MALKSQNKLPYDFLCLQHGDHCFFKKKCSSVLDNIVIKKF